MKLSSHSWNVNVILWSGSVLKLSLSDHTPRLYERNVCCLYVCIYSSLTISTELLSYSETRIKLGMEFRGFCVCLNVCRGDKAQNKHRWCDLCMKFNTSIHCDQSHTVTVSIHRNFNTVHKLVMQYLYSRILSLKGHSIVPHRNMLIISLQTITIFVLTR